MIVSEAGNVILFYKDDLPYHYQWVQFDAAEHRLDFITTEGETQDFGFNIPETLHEKLQKTNEVLLVRVNEDKTCESPQFIKFAKTLD